MVTRQPLAGIGVVVTRPRGQGEALCARLEELGAETFHVPVLAIEALTPEGGWAAASESIRQGEVVIFVSANAVRQLHEGLPEAPALLGEANTPTDRPKKILAVGPATARALETAGISVDTAGGEGMDSESLLADPALSDVAGRRVVIVRGEGGRRVLDRTLAERGAEVTALAVYRRVPADLSPEALLGPLREGRAHVITATSREILDAIHALAGEQGRDLVRAAGLVVASERVLQRAAELGLRETSQTASRPDDHGLVEAILEWARRRRERPTR